MGAFRLTKPERAITKDAVELLLNNPLCSLKAAERKAAESVLSKLAMAEEFGAGGMKRKVSGVPVKRAIELFRAVLGPRLVLPPNPDGAWWAINTRALSSGGFTESDLTLVAQAAFAGWRGPVKIESLIRQASVLLHSAGEPVEVSKPRQHPSAPLAMEKV